MYKKTALELHQLFTQKKVSCEELTCYFLKRIEKYDKHLKSFICVYSNRAIKKAKDLDKKLKEKKQVGCLAGIPIAIKDNIHIKGEITTCGSKFLTNYKAVFNATVIDLLEKQDAIILGKTNMDEFAMGSSGENSSFFPTKNPWDLNCVPGGSSAGSAASTAARLVPVSLGTDTGGSIRQPAAFCGLAGFKPTYGRVSRYGLVAYGSSLDHIGPIATNVKDLALIMEVIGKSCRKDSTSFNLPNEIYLEKLPTSFKGIKMGVPFHFLKDLQPSVYKNFEESLKILKELGCEILDINLDILKYCIAAYYIIATAEASTNLARFDGIKYGHRSKNAKTLNELYELSREEGFGAEVKRRIMLGTYVLSSGYQNAYYKKAQKVRNLMIQAFEDAFSACDFIAIPTSPNSCFELNSIQDPIQMYLQDLFTIPANLTGLPAISLPSGFDNGKPLSLQILAPGLHDVKLVQYANVFDEKTKFSQKIPPLFDKE
jgi:aspartyl-tRNA(Asn)/glutamyl-tRNA(Gln) amidotransferase subunit A